MTAFLFMGKMMNRCRNAHRMAVEHSGAVALLKKFCFKRLTENVAASVTRAFFESLNFLVKTWKNCEKGPKLCKKVKIYVIKYNLLNFYYLLNIVD